MKYLIRLSLLFAMCCMNDMKASSELQELVRSLIVAKDLAWKEFKTVEKTANSVEAEPFKQRWFEIGAQLNTAEDQLRFELDPGLKTRREAYLRAESEALRERMAVQKAKKEQEEAEANAKKTKREASAKILADRARNELRKQGKPSVELEARITSLEQLVGMEVSHQNESYQKDIAFNELKQMFDGSSNNSIK